MNYFKNNFLRIIFIPVILFYIQSFLIIIPNDIRNFSDFLNQLTFFSYALKIFLVIVIIIIFSFYQRWSLSGEVKHFNTFCATRPQIIDDQINRFVKEYKSKHIDLRINVMLSKFKVVIWQRLLKWERPFLFQRQLNTVYHFNMDRDMDKDLKLTTNQGVTGLAYKEGQIVADFEKVDKNHFKLTKDQLNKTKNIKFVISTPIFELDIPTRKLTNKIIGVVNIDSNMNTLDTLKRKNLIENLQINGYNIAEFLSLLY